VKKKTICHLKNFFYLSSYTSYFFTLLLILSLLFKVLSAAQYLSVVDNHSPILFYFPLSVVLAAPDILFYFVIAKLFDLLHKLRFSKYLSLLVFIIFAVLFNYEFAIYQYFRCYTNFGLLEFLVFSPKTDELLGETLFYFLGAINPFLLSMILSSIGAALLFAIAVFKEKTLLFRGLSEKSCRKVVIICLCFDIFLSRIPYEEKVRMDQNPIFEYAKTRVLQSFHLPMDYKGEKTQLPEFIREKKPFQPIDLTYDFAGKNLIFILIESTAFENTTLANNPASTDPFLKELADKSWNFLSHRTVFPATTRSILAMLCSDIPGTDYASITNTKEHYKCNSITTFFKKNGFNTSFFSPVLLSYDSFDKAEQPREFDYIFEPSSVLSQKKYKKTHGTNTAVEEEYVQNEFFKYYTQNREPFFALYFPYWSHAPYEEPFADHFGMERQERYYASQGYIDTALRKFFEDLDAKGFLENSIVIVTSDHGEALGRKPGNYIHPNFIYDENLHVPFLIYIKGITDKYPKTITNPTTVLDVAPTIANLLGLEKDPSWIGNDMFSGQISPVFIYSRAAELHSGILNGNKKFFFNHVTGQNYFFDLASDPMEENNLAATLTEEDIESIKNYILYENAALNQRALKMCK